MSHPAAIAEARKREEFLATVRSLAYHNSPGDVYSQPTQDLRLQLLEAVDRNRQLAGAIEFGLSRIEALESALQKERTSAAALKSQNEVLSAKLVHMQGHCELLQDRLDRETAERKRLESLASVQEHTQQLEQHSADMLALRQRIVDLEHQLIERDTRIRVSAQEIGTLRERVSALETTEAELRAQLKTEHELTSRANQLAVQARTATQRIREQLEAEQAARQRAERDLLAAQQALQAAPAEAAAAVQRELDTLQQKLRHMSAERVRLQLRVAALSGQLARTRSLPDDSPVPEQARPPPSQARHSSPPARRRARSQQPHHRPSSPERRAHPPAGMSRILGTQPPPPPAAAMVAAAPGVQAPHGAACECGAGAEDDAAGSLGRAAVDAVAAVPAESHSHTVSPPRSTQHRPLPAGMHSPPPRGRESAHAIQLTPGGTGAAAAAAAKVPFVPGPLPASMSASIADAYRTALGRRATAAGGDSRPAIFLPPPSAAVLAAAADLERARLAALAAKAAVLKQRAAGGKAAAAQGVLSPTTPAVHRSPPQPLLAPIAAAAAAAAAAATPPPSAAAAVAAVAAAAAATAESEPPQTPPVWQPLLASVSAQSRALVQPPPDQPPQPQQQQQPPAASHEAVAVVPSSAGFAPASVAPVPLSSGVGGAAATPTGPLARAARRPLAFGSRDSDTLASPVSTDGLSPVTEAWQAAIAQGQTADDGASAADEGELEISRAAAIEAYSLAAASSGEHEAAPGTPPVTPAAVVVGEVRRITVRAPTATLTLMQLAEASPSALASIPPSPALLSDAASADGVPPFPTGAAPLSRYATRRHAEYRAAGARSTTEEEDDAGEPYEPSGTGGGDSSPHALHIRLPEVYDEASAAGGPPPGTGLEEASSGALDSDLLDSSATATRTAAGAGPAPAAAAAAVAAATADTGLRPEVTEPEAHSSSGLPRPRPPTNPPPAYRRYHRLQSVLEHAVHSPRSLPERD